MKAKSSLLLSVLLFSCAMGQVVFGQYAPPSGPPSLPMGAFGGPSAPSFMPPGPAYPHPAPFGQFGPAMPAPQFAGQPVMPATFASAASGKSPFRVYADGEGKCIPDKEITLASMRKNGGKVKACSDQGDAKGGKDGPCYCVRVFGEYLYLRARDAEVAYAVDANSGIGPPPVQVSPIALLDPDYSTGFRAGFGICCDDYSEVSATYTFFETSTYDEITSSPPITQVVSMVIHPATPNAVIGTVQAAGRHDMEFDLIDLDYRRLWWGDDLGLVNWVAGVRWGRFEQNFYSVFTDSLVGPPINEVTVLTDIDFTGAGVHLGIEGERYASRWPFMVYGKLFTSLMAGEFEGTYQQTVQAGANFGVDTSWKAGRIVPTFDLELGGGFCCSDGTFRATVGYVFSAWTNMVKTEDWIHAVQVNDFRDMGDTITFDGLVGRVEWRF